MKLGKETKFDHFTMLFRNYMETPAWRALSSVAQALYPWLKLEWNGPKFNNNGKIRLSVRQAAERLGVSPNTAASAFHDLQAKGFIVVTEMPVLGLEGAARSTAYEITELALPHGAKADGRKLFKQWKEGRDFPVHKARANNPSGRNGRTKTHLKIDDSKVIELKTSSRKASSL